MRIPIITLLISAAAAFFSCQDKSTYSPTIAFAESGALGDTVVVKQRFPLQMPLRFDDPTGLYSYTIRINDSVHQPVRISGNTYQLEYDTAFRNAGLYLMWLTVTNTQGLDSRMHIPVRADSIRRPSLAIYGFTGKTFGMDTAVEPGQTQQFAIIAKRGELPLDSLLISTSSGSAPLVAHTMRSEPFNTDSASLSYTTEPIYTETTFLFKATDSVDLRTTLFVSVKVKK